MGGIAMLSAVPTLAQGFVQIVNLKANYSVTVSSLRCQVGTVKEYDSSGQNTTPDFLSQLTVQLPSSLLVLNPFSLTIRLSLTKSNF